MASAVPLSQPIIGSVEAEMAVLGAMLREPKVVDSVADRLRPDHFADKFLGHVYSLILKEHSSGRPASPFTIRPLLESDPAYAEMGGWAWLAELASNSATVIIAKSSIAQIIEFAQRRSLIEGLREAIGKAEDYESPVDEAVEAADSALGAARESEVGHGEVSGGDCLRSVIEAFDEPLDGVQCGSIPSIDMLLGPLRPTDFIVGAGRPGMGKTATAISYALGAAERGHGVLFISLEMGAEQLGERMAADLCLASKVPYEGIRDRKLTADQRREVCRAHRRISEMPLQIIDRSGLSPPQVRTLVRRWQRRFEATGHKLELVVVDYLQLMRVPKSSGRYEVITEISQALKEIAKENRVAVLALSQLSRAVEQRADKRPQLSDLRESGQIEQDADSVLFFLRDEYYLRLAEPHINSPERAAWEDRLQRCGGGIEFICAKRRNGCTGSRTGEFLYAYQAVRG